MPTGGHWYSGHNRGRRTAAESSRGGPRISVVVGPEPIAIADVLGAPTAASAVPPARWRELAAACGELPPPPRAAVLRWCDIQLAGFDHDWISDHSVPVPARSASEVAGLLGLTLG
ncbi:hypothetical protein [Nocardia sp. NBC_01329]|uniref:hypothetical protein n=1 Tax=Nocardia sp. NBC_01329 TaxID=2903594 RepID=UPI002E16840C|nr:hypothetical protein OG405_15365 [Nocardia sp. NBC_01329]